MASRFWVGGTGNWDAATTTHWSATTGGAGGASVPTSADTVTFNGSSGGGTVTITATANCSDFSSVGFTGTLAGSAALNIAGSAALGGTITYTGAITFTSTATGKTIASNGKTLGSNVTFNGVGGGWTQSDAFSTSGTMTLTNGAYSDGGFSLTCSTFSSNNGNVRSLTKSANWTITGSGSAVQFTNATNMTATFDATKDWTLTNSGATATSFQSNTALPNAGNVKVTAGTYTFTLNGANAAGGFANIDFTGFAGTMSTGTFSFTGNYTQGSGMSNTTGGTATYAGTTAKTLRSNGVPFNHALTVNGAGSLALADALSTASAITLTQGALSDGGFTVTAPSFSSNNSNTRTLTKTAGWTITGTGTVFNVPQATGLTFTSSGGWTFTDASATTRTAASAAGLTIADKFAVSAGSGTFAMTGVTGTTLFSDLDFTGFAGTWTTAPANIRCSGNVTLGASMTVGANVLELEMVGPGAQTLKTNGVLFDRGLRINCGAGSVTLLDALNMTARAYAHPSGTFNDGGFPVTAFSINSGSQFTSTRAINKSGLWTITGTGNLINFPQTNVVGYPVGFSITDSGGWKFTDSSAATKIIGTSAAMSNVWLAPGAGTGAWQFVGGMAFSQLKDDGSAAHAVQFDSTSGFVYSVVDWQVSGTAGNLISLSSRSAGSQFTINKTGGGKVTADYLSATDMIGAGNGYCWFLGDHSTNLGNNLGVAFCSPANASIMALEA